MQRHPEYTVFCNVLEDDGEPAKLIDGAVEIPYTPFRIISVKLKL